MRDSRWLWTLKAFYPPNHQSDPNGLAIETTHATDVSRDIELSVMRERLRKGHFSHVISIHHESPFEQQTYHADTELTRKRKRPQ